MKKEIEQKVDIDYADRVVPEEGKKAFGEKGSYLSSAMISFTQIGHVITKNK